MRVENGTIKVLVVDDSALMRNLLTEVLQSEKGIEVIGTAMDGRFALEKIPRLKPDIVILDTDMPHLDGLETLKVVVREYNLPVIMLSTAAPAAAEIVLKALELGAFDFVARPENVLEQGLGEAGEKLISCVREAYLSKKNHPAGVTEKSGGVRKEPSAGYICDNFVIGIGVSTGGPQALARLIPQFPENWKVPIVIVQHMPPGFIHPFARRLDSISRLRVRVADEGEKLATGRVYLAPGDVHLRVARKSGGYITVYDKSNPKSGHRPSADVLFSSLAESAGSRAIGVIMTGMGADGAEGLGQIKTAGGITIAQDETSSTVFGMPRIAIEKGYADTVVSLDKIYETISRSIERRVACGNIR